MFALHTMFAVTAALALGMPAVAQAQDSRFEYVEGGFIGGFVNDVEGSGTISGNDGTLDLESDAGGGGFIGGAWQFSENLHLFGEYSSASQDLEVRDGVDEVEGEFDVVRWRVGLGYSHAVSPALDFYGRLSYDNTAFEDLRVAGFNLDTDVDEGGVGGEVGMIWAATPAIDVQGHVRYTAVGGVADDGTDGFESDILLGVNGRWQFRPGFALVTGYEFGKITTVNAGLRFSF